MTRELLDDLIEALEQRADDWASLWASFLAHARSTFLTDFLARELGAAAHDSDHIVRRGVGQASFTFVHTPDLE